jgi:hypothetical protein
VGSINWEDEDIFKKGVKVRSDFDTENPEYTVLDERLCRSIEKETSMIRRGYYLGILYLYLPRMMKIGVTDGNQNRCLEKLVG